MSAADVATVVLAVVAVIGLVFGALAWIYNRGAGERELTDAVKANTTATDKLTAHVEKIGDTLAQHGEKLADHEARLRSGGL